MAQTYAEWLQNIKARWLQGPNAQGWLGSLGGAVDMERDLAVQSVKARMPTQCPADALSYIGDERGLDRGPSWLETNAQYGLRLRKAWIAKSFAGTWPGLLYGIYWGGFWGGNYSTGIMGAGGVVIAQQNGVYYQLTGPSNPDDLTAGVTVTATGLNTSVNNPGPAYSSLTQTAGGLPLGAPWWTMDANVGFCSRYAILFPGPYNVPNSPFVNAVQVTFAGTEDGSAANPWPTATWSHTFADATYRVLIGGQQPLSGGGPTAFAVINKRAGSCQIQAAARWAGTVDLIAYEAGANPFANLTAPDLARLRDIIKKWAPAKATCTGIYLLVQGNFIGWPLRSINTNPTIGPPATIVRYAP
jgi:hypothetical protein